MGRSGKISDMPNAPVFSAYRATNQSVTTSTWEKVQRMSLTHFQGALVRVA